MKNNIIFAAQNIIFDFTVKKVFTKERLKVEGSQNFLVLLYVNRKITTQEEENK